MLVVTPGNKLESLLRSRSMPGPDSAKYTPEETSKTGDDRYYFRKMRDILQNSSQSNGTNGSAYTPTGPPLYPVQLMDHVYIGNQRNADNVELLRRLGITHVLNCAGLRRYDFTRSPYPKEAGIKGFLMISAEDHEDFDMKRHFDDAIAFLDSVKRSRGKALVHCNLGVNRSGVVVAAYLMAAEKRTLLDVTNYLKAKRSFILSNKGFRRQLISFARERGLLDPVVDVDGESSPRTDTGLTVDGIRQGRNETSTDGPNLADGCRPTPIVIVDGNHLDSAEHMSRTSWPIGSSAVRVTSHNDTDRFSTSKAAMLLSPVYERPSREVDEMAASSMFGGFLTLLGGRRKPFRSTSYSNVSQTQAASAVMATDAPGTQATKTLSSTLRPLRVYTRSSTDSELYRPPSYRGRPSSATLSPPVNHQRFPATHQRPAS